MFYSCCKLNLFTCEELCQFVFSFYLLNLISCLVELDVWIVMGFISCLICDALLMCELKWTWCVHCLCVMSMPTGDGYPRAAVHCSRVNEHARGWWVPADDGHGRGSSPIVLRGHASRGKLGLWVWVWASTIRTRRARLPSLLATSPFFCIGPAPISWPHVRRWRSISTSTSLTISPRRRWYKPGV